MADLRISELPPIRKADLQGRDLLPVADLSASETKSIDVEDFLEAGLQFIDDGTLPGVKLVADSVTAREVAPNAITARELADGAVDTPAIQDLAVVDAKVGAGLNGAKLTDDTVSAAKIPPASLDRGLDKTSGAIGHSNAILQGTRSGISFDDQGHVTAHRALIGSDLPPATDTSLGGVSVPAGSGLQVSGTGALGHDNQVAPTRRSGISYDEHGHVVSSVPLVGTDLPNATEQTTGAVSVPSLPLQVVNGVLSHVVSPAGIGTYAKVRIDDTGHVVEGSNLVPGDIPGLDASAITSGQFGRDRLAINSVTAQQLADYGIAQVSQTRPKPEFAGQWWINPIDRSAFIWIGTVDGPGTVENGYWMNLGYGTAVEQNARFGGTYDASTNLVESISTYGNLAGVVAGNPVPSPTQTNAGLYLIVTVPGAGVTPAPEEALAVGVWIFSLGTGTNWIKSAVVSGAGGAVNDEDVLVVGADFSVPMPNVADQQAANELMWGYCQVASGVQRGTVKPSSEVLVDVDGVMTVGPLDEGQF